MHKIFVISRRRTNSFSRRFSAEELVPIFHQLAAALDYAHTSTWHGDLKPENIIILPDLLKVTDFNLVKALPLLLEGLHIVGTEVPFPTLYDDFFEAVREDFEHRLRNAVLATARGLGPNGVSFDDSLIAASRPCASTASCTDLPA